MDGPPRLGWWQASDGEWYPPELHPNYRPAPLAPPQPAHLGVHHAHPVHPNHPRPGAGDYTVAPVTTARRGPGAVLLMIAGVLAALVLAGVMVLLVTR